MKELDSALIVTFEDFRLSGGEKHALKEVLLPYKDDLEALHFARNRAFDLVQTQLRESATHHSESVKWLAQVVKLIENVGAHRSQLRSSVHFSPGSECATQIRNQIKYARKSVDVCVFTISDDSISNELATAHKRGVTVRIITDDEKSEDTGSDIHWLIKKGVPVKFDDNPSHMHHKFAVIDNNVVINGSFNWTRSASRYNHEDIVINNNPDIVSEFVNRFSQLWSTFKTVSPSNGPVV